MKLRIFLVAAISMLVMSCDKVGGDVTPNSDKEKTLYVLGAQLGRNLEDFHFSDGDLKYVVQGMKDKATGKPVVVQPSQEYFEKIKGLMEAPMKEKAKVEIEAGEKFLAEAQKQEGAKVQKSGLIYIETKAGGGKNPTPQDFVKVYYRGTLRDGKEFDSNMGKEPAKFPLGGVIPCWTEGLQLMKVGGKGILFCPAGIAYGYRGSPPVIPGGAALKFEVELLGIEAAPKMDPASLGKDAKKRANK